MGNIQKEASLQKKGSLGCLDTKNFSATFSVRKCSLHGGSQPPGFQGLQRQMRQMPRKEPRIAPYFRTDSMKYLLQLGWNRQCCPNMGLMKS